MARHRTFEQFMDDLAAKVINYRSSAKVTLDSYLDPSIAWTAMNALSLYGGDQALEWVNSHTDDHRGLAMIGAYAAIAGGIVAANKYLIVPASRRIRQWHQARKAHGERATLLGWGKTALLAGALGVGLTHDAFRESMRNYQSDGKRIVAAFERTEEIAPDITAPEEKDTLPDYPTQRNGTQQTGALEGHNLHDLYAIYTGISGRVPETARVDFEQQLNSMWDRKEAFMARRGLKNPVIKQMREERVAQYGDRTPTRMTLDEYLQRNDATISAVKDAVDWETVGRLKRLDKHELALLRRIGMSLNGNDIMAYGLTELMPSADGHLNKAVLDFLLRNAGAEYVHFTPALFDGKLSIGPYQFTEYALFDTPREKRGASIINQALPAEHRIPGSMILLDGDDHAKAAYLFAVNNLADGIKALSRNEYDVLAKKWSANKDDIVQYIATAHHLPADARRSLRRWLSNGAKSDYSISCGPKLGLYARKTKGNLSALYRHN